MAVSPTIRPTPGAGLNWLVLLIIAGVAGWLRTHELSRRPMHADEANQAVKAGELLESGHYAFDPQDHHGPTLYYAVLPMAWSRGEHSLAALSETTVRLVPALFGTVAVILLGLLARPMGHGPALLAAALLATSPPAVYYSRYFIQETLLSAFFLGALLCAQRWWRQGGKLAAGGVGLCLGLMQATKASTPLFVAAALLALALARPSRPVSTRIFRDLLFVLVTALVVSVVLYSSLGRNFAGLKDAIEVYTHTWQRVNTGAGHEKPWWYYLQLFTWQKNGGLVWQQIPFVTLALAGLVAAMYSPANKLLRWSAGLTVLLVVLLSLSPYKTPWHAVHFVPGGALLAAGAMSTWARTPTRQLVALIMAGFVLWSLLTQTRLTAFQRPADARNPYAYVHTSPDMLKLRGLVETALQRFPDQPVRIVSEEYWPMPWYLRGLPRVGYWTTAPDECDGALIIASAGQAEAVQARLHGKYQLAYLGLRPGFVCVVFTPEP